MLPIVVIGKRKRTTPRHHWPGSLPKALNPLENSHVAEYPDRSFRIQGKPERAGRDRGYRRRRPGGAARCPDSQGPAGGRWRRLHRGVGPGDRRDLAPRHGNRTGRPAGYGAYRLSGRRAGAHRRIGNGRRRWPAPGAARPARSLPDHQPGRGRADPGRSGRRRRAHPVGLRRFRDQRRRRRHDPGAGRAPAGRGRSRNRRGRRRTGPAAPHRPRRSRSPAGSGAHRRRCQLAQRAARSARRGASVRPAEGCHAGTGGVTGSRAGKSTS